MSVVQTARYHEQRRVELAGHQIARQKAADKAEYEHRAAPNRRVDDDELLAMCGLPPRRR